MSRPQEFDTETALDAAMNVFWERGMHRASIDELLRATDLSRSSLYNRFGSKEALFSLAVERYVANQAARLQRLLDVRSFRDALQKLFHSAVSGNYDGRGCLLVNGAGSLMDGDDEEQRLLRAGFQRMLALVEARIGRAQAEGELQAAIDPAHAAMLVCATLSGLRIFHKAGMPAVRLKAAAGLAVDQLFAQFHAGTSDTPV